jgi:hypothetical protein
MTRVSPLLTPPPPNFASTASQLARTQSHVTLRPARVPAEAPMMAAPSCLRTASVMLNSRTRDINAGSFDAPIAPRRSDSSRELSASLYSRLSSSSSLSPPWRSADANTAPLMSAGIASLSPPTYASNSSRAAATEAGCSYASARDTASCRSIDVWYPPDAVASPPGATHPSLATNGANSDAPYARRASHTSSGCSKNAEVIPPSPLAISFLSGWS